ncbi:MAG TPA: hypothetical protein VM265_08005 [Sphingomicrobium sp.]|nr:hypothetical protein [Sphingomicrobium sp.]
MSQNRSSAVMQQRSEPSDSLDDFPTPPWATRALCEWLKEFHPALRQQSCREPAANRGHMVEPPEEYFGTVLASDVHDYGIFFPVRDYLFGAAAELCRTDWTITNPPFRLAEQFIDRALELSDLGCAMLVRSAFLEGVGRYERLFSRRPPTTILQFSERVVMHKGRLAPDGSTATAYCWLVWEHACCGTSLQWISPCRKALERPGDYPQRLAEAQPTPADGLFGERGAS